MALCLAVLPGSAYAHGAVPPKVEVITVGVFTVAPFVIGGDQGPTGILIDFFDHEIAPRMGVRFKWERPTTTARLERSLASGRIMFTPILAKTPFRLKAGIRFDQGVYIRFAPCLAVLPDHPLQAVTSPRDLEGINIGWVQAGALPSFMLDKSIKLDRVGTIEWTAANFEKLKFGRIGAAYFSNRYTPEYFSAQTGMPVRLISLPTPGPTLHGAFAPAAPAELRKRFSAAAAEAFADDRFSNYMHKAMVKQVLSPPKP